MPGHVRLADFGMAKDVKIAAKKRDIKPSKVGTIEYISPEMVLDDFTVNEIYDGDLFATGAFLIGWTFFFVV